MDAEWTPLLNTPGHPEYPSGHSATAGASAKVLETLLGETEAFTVGTEFPGLEPRGYGSVQEAADEVHNSRVYGGIHFRHSVTEGAKIGATVAEAVIEQFDGESRGCAGGGWWLEIGAGQAAEGGRLPALTRTASLPHSSPPADKFGKL